MNVGADEIGRPRPWDLFRPARLWLRMAARPTVVLPLVLLVASVVLYALIALRAALPEVIPRLLENSLSTESELAGAFRTMVLAVALLLPPIFLLNVSVLAYLLTRLGGARVPFPYVASLLAHASLWAALGFVAKTLLVLATGEPEPATSLALFVRLSHPVARIVLGFTNPFLLLALFWTVKGLRVTGVPPRTAWLGGAGPWAAWIVVIAIAAGTGSRFVPRGAVATDDWESASVGNVLLKHAPAEREAAVALADTLDAFARRLGTQYGFRPQPVRVHVFADHATLEKATGEFLHVQVTGSIRGSDLLYLELPGRSAAVPHEAGERDAHRYMALMQLAQAAPGAPRWFVQGLAHAEAIPYTPALERDFILLVRRDGLPELGRLFDPRIYRTPDGPLLARALLDFLSVRSGGREVASNILKDVIDGAEFRDALFARMRLTTGAVESEWRQATLTMLERRGLVTRTDSTVVITAPEAVSPEAGSPGAAAPDDSAGAGTAPDSAAADDETDAGDGVSVFRDRH